MDPRVTLITLGVRDLERARAFYRDGLGFPLSSMSDDDVAFFRTGGTVLALWPRHLLAEDAGLSPEGSGFAGMALAHNVQEKEQVDAVLAQAQAAGATILVPARDTFWGGYSGYFADPDGFAWEVAWGPDFTYDAAGAMILPE
ncbi:MAG: uncharacterized protein QOF51_4016 [Chloroflexota bacterium]|jgi:catechol 2,3-dioxygenase-like lactoylglutathione lyase family enzyme|nr:uncharacterized protein [Chloroflexota bacterium]